MTFRRATMAVLLAIALIGVVNVVSASAPAVKNAAPAPATIAAPAADPYLATDTAISSEAPVPMTGCQIYAYQCEVDGGPCANGLCHCQFRETGWVCGR